ncbi:MAG: DNA replication/repair protein RecF [Defluviitaleaceae bacterium]|nr:DNA replication/repair protein RecF [Defluviitaleaceae bacterium]
MQITSLNLKNFRNLLEQQVELAPHINIFYGDNGQGKTNFLESLYFCATGRSHRAMTDKELIAFDETDAFVQLKYSEGKIHVHLENGKKGISVNGMPIKKLGDLLGNLVIVMFSPEDLELAKEGPGVRRRFMDMEICKLSPLYYHELSSYYRVLRQRNNLLKSTVRERSLLDTIPVWDEALVSHGIKIYKLRKKFVEEIGEIAALLYQKIAGGIDSISLYYKPNVTPDNFLDKLTRFRERDLKLTTTTAGIHKDDIQILINERDIRAFGSQGQQRTASLSLKLAEIELIKNVKNKKPVLLLDDVLSELDEKRQKHLLSLIKEVQTIITCTGMEDVLKKISNDDTKIFYVENGKICVKQ